MREDSALSHLYDGEVCILTTDDGEREARWSISDWCFFYTGTAVPEQCRFENILEWRPASIRF